MSDNALSLYRGDDCHITDKLKIRQPTIGEVCDLGEDLYMQALGMVLAHPFEMIVQLDKLGIDFTTISEFELFALLCRKLPKEATRILFYDVDFSSMETYKIKDTGDMLIVNRDGVTINQYNYKIMCAFLRSMHNFSAPRYQVIANDYSKKMAIEEAYDQYKYKSKGEKPQKSMFLPLVSSLVNYSGFKYNLQDVWNLKMYQFFDAVKRVQAYETASHLYTALYSGAVEANKIRKDLDWMRDFA